MWASGWLCCVTLEWRRNLLLLLEIESARVYVDQLTVLDILGIMDAIDCNVASLT